MFCSLQGNTVSKYFLPYAQSLANAAIVEVPQATKTVHKLLANLTMDIPSTNS
jgi:hypothetical protein